MHTTRQGDRPEERGAVARHARWLTAHEHSDGSRCIRRTVDQDRDLTGRLLKRHVENWRQRIANATRRLTTRKRLMRQPGRTRRHRSASARNLERIPEPQKGTVVVRPASKG